MERTSATPADVSAAQNCRSPGSDVQRRTPCGAAAADDDAGACVCADAGMAAVMNNATTPAAAYDDMTDMAPRQGTPRARAESADIGRIRRRHPGEPESPSEMSDS